MGEPILTDKQCVSDSGGTCTESCSFGSPVKVSGSITGARDTSSCKLFGAEFRDRNACHGVPYDDDDFHLFAVLTETTISLYTHWVPPAGG